MKTLTTVPVWGVPGLAGLLAHCIHCPGEAMRKVSRRCLPAMFCVALAAAASAQTEQVTFNFSDTKTGGNPSDNGYLLVEPNGHVIGTAVNGGGADDGVVFEAIPPTATKSTWTYHVIHHFKGGPGDGYGPYNGLTKGKHGIFYGLTAWGGLGSIGDIGGCGVVYQLTPPVLSGTGKWAESVLYEFGANGDGDGCKPTNTQLLFDTKTGSLFGTTELGGGTAGEGTLFRLDPPAQAGGLWTETVLYRFSGGLDGGHPTGGLAGNTDGGALYGTTINGGDGYGMVWQYDTSNGVMGTAYDFQGGSDGASPQGGVIGPFPYNVEGSAYYLLGTTAAGGGSANCSGGCGTVFAINLTVLAFPPPTDSILHAFQGSDGEAPMSGLAMIDGAAWGTTEGGGGSANCSSPGCGTLFKIQLSGFTHITLTYEPVYNFQGGTGDGAFPTTGLAGDSAGNVFGLTEIGGTDDKGVLFEYVP